ncbi:hypothetical protein DYQ86_16150 [Acidobacteria bacterium AB60]|nr:hypothetical protein DYQ86_16150 [Acidobacteria bacterium AB60]
MRFDERTGLAQVGDTAIHLELLRRLADPDKRVLWRFEIVEGVLIARCYTEDQVIWTGDGTAAAEIILGSKT